jgi:pilus assembly protein CpaB
VALPMPSIEPTRRRPLHALARAASWHRRKLAVLAAVAAVLTGISAAAPEGPATITVVKAKSQLPGGTVVSGSDLVLDRVAASDVPEGVVTDPHALIGKTLAVPVAENQMMTPLTAIAARTSVLPGHVIAPLRLADTALATLLRPGDVVDVIAADTQAEQAVVVAAGARVVTIPEPPDEGPGPGPDGALVLIDVDIQTASAVAQAAASATLSIMWR